MEGVIKELTPSSKSYYTAADVSDLCGVCRDKAYKIIRSLREEAVKAGALPICYPAGKIPKSYFNRRMMV